MIIRFLKKYLLTEVLLWILSVVLEVLLSIVLGIFNYIAAILNWELRKYLLLKAFMNDVEGNVKFKYVLNFCFSNGKPGHQFGDPMQTISYVIGMKIKDGSANKFCIWFNERILERADPNHAEKAIRMYNIKIIREYRRITENPYLKLAA